MEDQIFKQNFSVRFVEIAPDGKLSLTSLLNFMQESAARHAESLGIGYSHLVQKNQTWVLSRLRLDVYQMPAWRDDLLIETWTKGGRGIMGNREMLIKDNQGKVIAASSAIWLLINLETKKPVRLDSETFQFPVIPDKSALEKSPEKLKALSDSPQEGSRFRIRQGDCDLNGHVNNTQYVRWMLDDIRDSLPNTPYSLQVNYQAESFCGDTLISVHEKQDDESIGLQIHREADQSEICRARIEKI